jgi:Asp-tRNA(Asn)/Glu-tRNA(Gln) amidotransferase C subunit
MTTEPHMTREILERMASEVARIDLSPPEIDQLTPQLDRLLSDLAQVPDADLQDCEPPLFFAAGALEPGGPSA